MHRKKYIYAGNRSTVLRRMISLGLDVQYVLPTVGSWLEREMPDLKLPYTTISTKQQTVDFLESKKFDVFVSTGFRFILPITQLRATHPEAEFVNVHPSFLPDLRGADPIPGAVLFGRDSGVTCHLMDDGIDTGTIVAQRKIPYFEGLDSKLLYKLCFELEPAVFEDAFRLEFAAANMACMPRCEHIYYTFKIGDDVFHESDDAAQLVRRVRAFNTPKRGLQFTLANKQYRAFEALAIEQSLGFNLNFPHGSWELVGSYEDCLLVAKNKTLVRLSGITPVPTGHLGGRFDSSIYPA